MVSMTLDRRIRSLNRSWMIDDHGTRVMIIFLCIQWKTLSEQGYLYIQKIWDDNPAALWALDHPGMGSLGSGLGWR